MPQSTESRMAQVFRNVFPELADGDLAAVNNAKREQLDSWDSGNHLLLLTCIEEEFNVSLPDDEAAQIESFPQAVALIGTLQ